MSGAFLWGAFAASSLLVGAGVAMVRPVGNRVLGLIMGFGAGVLISALAYDLVAEAFVGSQGAGIWLGLFVGAVTFYVGDAVIDRAGGAERKSIDAPGEATVSGPALVLGILLDGIPESAVIGITLLSGEGVSVAVIVAVFLSNLPEALAATAGLDRAGMPRARIWWMWLGIVMVSGLAAFLGFVLLDGASAGVVAFVQAFAAGAILVMLIDTMIPEAAEHGGPAVGLASTFGFALAFLIATLERSG